MFRTNAFEHVAGSQLGGLDELLPGTRWRTLEPNQNSSGIVRHEGGFGLGRNLDLMLRSRGIMSLRSLLAWEPEGIPERAPRHHGARIEAASTLVDI